MGIPDLSAAITQLLTLIAMNESLVADRLELAGFPLTAQALRDEIAAKGGP